MTPDEIVVEHRLTTTEIQRHRNARPSIVSGCTCKAPFDGENAVGQYLTHLVEVAREQGRTDVFAAVTAAFSCAHDEHQAQEHCPFEGHGRYITAQMNEALAKADAEWVEVTL